MTAAIYVLLHYAEASPEVAPMSSALSPAELVDAIAKLHELGMLEPLNDERTDWGLTAKGMQWQTMIEATPMPVQMWSDPRGDVTARAEVADRFLEALDKFASRPAPAAAPPPRHRATRLPSEGAPPVLPQGFTPWGGEDVNPVAPPENSTEPMPDVFVMYITGKLSKKMPASTVIWGHKGGDFDVIGYRSERINDPGITGKA